MQLAPELLQALLDSSIDAVFLMNAERRFLYVSPAFADLSGHAPEELVADPGLFERLIHPEDRPLFKGHLDDFAAPAHAKIDLRLIARDGSLRWITHSCKPVHDSDSGKVIGRLSHNRDITARKEDELRLRAAVEQARRFNDALDNVSAFVFIRDRDHRFLYANRLTVEFFDCSLHRLIGSADTHHFPPETIRQLRELDQRALAGDDIAGEVTVRQDGQTRIFSVLQSPLREEGPGSPVIGITGIATDITAARQLQDSLVENLAYQKKLSRQLEETQNQLLQSERLASIGQLAAGVAHEINNPIGFVSSNCNTLETYLRDLVEIIDARGDAATVEALKREKDYDFLRTDAFQLLGESRDGLQRVARIVRDLKDFSRFGAAEWKADDLNAGLDATLNLLPTELRRGIGITKDYGVLPPVQCIIAELNQVFLNLLTNACQALAGQGEITIRTGRQGDQVFVAIADNGRGIAPENLKHVFDPFFTTQPVGKGTGLGLSLAHGIVRKHQGRIEVRSELGKGTTFTVWLPVDSAASGPGSRSP